MSKRRILHVDMDAFFASIEQRDHPRLRGKPVIIGGLEGRGVASTCSYEARKFGVRSAMPIAEAKRLCPEGIFLTPNGAKYAYASVKVLEILEKYSPCVEPASIDEAYLDITSTAHLIGGEKALGRLLKDEIYKRIKLTCSVGIAPTRVFAKIGSNIQKPDGLTIITDENVRTILHPLPVETISGVGEKSSVLLHQLGIDTIGDLAAFDRKVLRQCFGIYGESLSRIAQGESTVKVTSLSETEDEKSIGHEHTLMEDTNDVTLLRRLLLLLSQRTARRLRKRKMMGRIAVLKLRYANFHTVSKRHTFQDFFWEEDGLFQAVFNLFKDTYQCERKVRLLGVTVAGLVRKGSREYGQGIQTNLFESNDRKDRLHLSIDALKDSHGDEIIKRAATVGFGK